MATMEEADQAVINFVSAMVPQCFLGSTHNDYMLQIKKLVTDSIFSIGSIREILKDEKFKIGDSITEEQEKTLEALRCLMVTLYYMYRSNRANVWICLNRPASNGLCMRQVLETGGVNAIVEFQKVMNEFQTCGNYRLL